MQEHTYWDHNTAASNFHFLSSTMIGSHRCVGLETPASQQRDIKLRMCPFGSLRLRRNNHCSLSQTSDPKRSVMRSRLDYSMLSGFPFSSFYCMLYVFPYYRQLSPSQPRRHLGRPFVSVGCRIIKAHSSSHVLISAVIYNKRFRSHIVDVI